MLGKDIMRMFGTAAPPSGGGGDSSGIVLADDFVGNVRIAEWTLGYDGYVYHRQGSGAAVKKGPWINPQVGMNLYQVNVTVTSGDSPDQGDLGNWDNLGSVSLTWGFHTVYTPYDSDLQVQIRRASDGTILKTTALTLTVYGLA